jgi:hypothetical protein
MLNAELVSITCSAFLKGFRVKRSALSLPRFYAFFGLPKPTL